MKRLGWVEGWGGQRKEEINRKDTATTGTRPPCFSSTTSSSSLSSLSSWGRVVRGWEVMLATRNSQSRSPTLPGLLSSFSASCLSLPSLQTPTQPHDQY